MRRATVTAALLSTLLLLAGCKSRSRAIPRIQRPSAKVQQCLRSDTSAEVCRMGEQDANKIEKGNKH